MRKVNLLISFFFVCFCTVGYAQQLPVAAGGNNSGIGGSVSYSVGQVFYETNGGAGGFEYQGIQQAYEIFSVIITGKKENKINLSIASYPNPATDFLVLDMGNLDVTASMYAYSIYDIKGQTLLSGKIVASKTELNVGNFPVAAYFLKVTEKNNLIGSFTIIKK